MPAHRARALILALVLTTPIALAGCMAVNGPGADGDDRPLVIATFYPVGHLAQRIAGEAVNVEILVGAGVEPHSFEPSVRDMARLGQSALVISQGVGFEPWLPGLIANLDDKAPPVVEATRGLQLREAGDHDHEHHDGDGHDGDGHDEHAHDGDEHDEHDHEDADYDPHTWLDPVLYAQQARVVEAALADAFPEFADAFGERTGALVAELDALDGEYEAALAECDVREIVVNHNAFAYPAERYGFNVHAVYGLAPGSEPDSKTIAHLVDLVEEHGLDIVFHEELVSPRVAEVIAEETGAEVRQLSPIEGLTPDAAAHGEDYFSLMRLNLDNLAEAMKCA